MKLKKYRVQNYKNIHDSGIIGVDNHITCLVGKNESGKTALLEALCKTNPADSTVTGFNDQVDYPKKRMPTNNADVRDIAIVECNYELEDTDIQEVKKILGEGVLTGRCFSVKTYYNENQEFIPDDIEANEQIAFNNLIDKTKLSADQKEKLKNVEGWSEFLDTINVINNTNSTPETQEVANLAAQINRHGHLGDPLRQYILNVIIQPLIPKFFYLDEYPQLKGSENIDTLFSRGSTEDPRSHDGLLASFLEMAGLDYHRMRKVYSRNQMENIYGGDDKIADINQYLSEEIFKYWSQNKHLKIQIDPNTGGSEDPSGMQSGINIWIKNL